MKMNEKDMLWQIDFDAAFPETPESIHDAVILSGEAIRRYERRKHISVRILSCAAAVIFAILGIAMFVSNDSRQTSDLITPPSLSEADVYVDPETIVYASKNGAYYHADPSCELMDELAVELPLVTANEFAKQPCPACAKDVILKTEKSLPAPANTNQENHAAEERVIISSGAAEALAELSANGVSPLYESAFFGGRLKAFESSDGSIICTTDPTPDESIFNYVLTAKRDIPAEEYYAMNDGPGIYPDYNAELKMLVTDYGDYAEYHTVFDTVIKVEIIDEATGECAWYFTPEQYECFRNEKQLFMSENSIHNSNMSAALES